MIRIQVLIHEFVTGGGLAGQELPPSWAAEGHAMRRALARDFAAIDDVSVVMTLDDRFAGEPGLWDVVRVRDSEEAATFARLAAECDYTLCVAPETGGLLEERARVIERVGGRSMGCSPDAIALCGDKLRCGEHLRARGIDTPRSVRVVPREGLPGDHPYPAVLKPIEGAGCVDTYFVESPGDLPDGARAMPEAILQPFVPGSAMSASFLVSERGEPRLIGVAEQHVERRGHGFAYLGGRLPVASPDLASVLAAIRSVPGLRGWVGVDFLYDHETGRVVVLEVNPRATTSYVGWTAIACGDALPRTWLELGSAPIFLQDVSIRFTAAGRIRREAVRS